jgi:hypothetical protein
MTHPCRCLLLLLAWPAPLLAQRPSIDPPLAGRPVDFSNVVGQYAIQATAEPTEVQVEDPITLRIVITGEGEEQYQPRREHLRLFPAWDDDFYVQEIREEHTADRDKKTWLFVYRLRPKHTKIDVIDDIKLVFYNPDKPGKVKFETRRAEPIAIVVKAKRDKPIEVPLKSAPDSFYSWLESPDLLSHTPPPFVPSGALMVSILSVPPLAFLLGAWARRRYFPDEGERRQRQRSLAAKRALEQLQAGVDPAWVVLGRYLHERFDLAVDEPTPADVAAFLKRRGFARDLCGQCLAFFRAGDAVVYASGRVSTHLSDEAARLVHALEADPCARG